MDRNHPKNQDSRTDNREIRHQEESREGYRRNIASAFPKEGNVLIDAYWAERFSSPDYHGQ